MSEKPAPPAETAEPAEGQEAGIRTALIAGPIIAAVGIAWTAAAPSTMSSAAVLVGLATSIWGTHRFGRLGAEGSISGP